MVSKGNFSQCFAESFNIYYVFTVSTQINKADLGLQMPVRQQSQKPPNVRLVVPDVLLKGHEEKQALDI